jgi:hypothetical protein
VLLLLLMRPGGHHLLDTWRLQQRVLLLQWGSSPLYLHPCPCALLFREVGGGAVSLLLLHIGHACWLRWCFGVFLRWFALSLPQPLGQPADLRRFGSVALCGGVPHLSSGYTPGFAVERQVSPTANNQLSLRGTLAAAYLPLTTDHLLRGRFSVCASLMPRALLRLV